eukprot:9821391-Alexandrium_andersonii.AAC.1
MLAPHAESREVGSEVEEARGLDRGCPVLALVGVDHADAGAEREGDGLPEVEQGTARKETARARPVRLWALEGEPDPE